MLEVILGVALVFFAATQVAEVKEPEQGAIFYEHHIKDSRIWEHNIAPQPVSDFRFSNVVRQQYDYSCGSAAMTTLLNHYLGRNYTERQVMEGLLQFGETEKIVQRRGFSLLDMRRLATALGHPSGGFRAKLEDLKTLEHPAIVPIDYAGFKHFVVLRDYQNGHFYVADPAMGNLSFTETLFEKIWDQNVVYIIFPDGYEPQEDLALTDYDLRQVDEQTISHLAMYEFEPFSPWLENWADRAATVVPVLWENPQTGKDERLHVPTRTYMRSK